MAALPPAGSSVALSDVMHLTLAMTFRSEAGDIEYKLSKPGETLSDFRARAVRYLGNIPTDERRVKQLESLTQRLTGLMNQVKEYETKMQAETSIDKKLTLADSYRSVLGYAKELEEEKKERSIPRVFWEKAVEMLPER